MHAAESGLFITFSDSGIHKDDRYHDACEDDKNDVPCFDAVDKAEYYAGKAQYYGNLGKPYDDGKIGASGACHDAPYACDDDQDDVDQSKQGDDQQYDEGRRARCDHFAEHYRLDRQSGDAGNDH